MTGEKLTVKTFRIDADNLKALREAEANFIRAGFDDENMNRTLEQNELLHVRIRACSKQWNQLVREGREGFDKLLSEESMKEFLLLACGNKQLITGPGTDGFFIAMRSSKYKSRPCDLTDADKREGFISMQELLSEIEAFAARELWLDLESGEVMDSEWWERQAA